MLKRLSRIAPFLIVTLVCIVAVEVFYGVAEYYIFSIDREHKKETKTAEVVPKESGKLQRHKDYEVIVRRNLFNSYTKEQAAENQSDNAPLEKLETTTLELSLLGTIKDREGRSRAVILDRTENKQDLFYKGDYIQGAEIKKIMRGKVILSYQGNDEMLDMIETSSKRPNNAAVSPTPRREKVISQPEPIQPKRRVIPSN
uniref:type II secretion system protein N n=1 Tax=Candidatus Electrothrix sp. TaxID=2170559 RepID=UPI0040565C82